jgi:putative transposase
MKRIAPNPPSVNPENQEKIDSRALIIQTLLPLGLEYAKNWLEEEVAELTGAKYVRDRNNANRRWGGQPGSIFLGDSKVKVSVPRVRDIAVNEEIPLRRYQVLQNRQTVDETALSKVLAGISCRDYKKTVTAVPETFGMSGSAVSRRYIRTSQQKLQALLDRRLDDHDIVSVFIDGKRFGDDGIVVALGVTITGQKLVLGIVQTASENHVVCGDFLKGLIRRGLNPDKELLFVVDGSKGFAKAIKLVFGNKAFIQRCQWHKRENVLKYLPERQRPCYRRKLQQAYSCPDYQEARSGLVTVYRELKDTNLSAAKSLAEGLDETLTLHRLGLFAKLGTSLKTTNCIESVLSQAGRITRRVSRWRNSSQKQRWVATALLEIEPKLRKLKGSLYLSQLRAAMQAEITKKAAFLKAA